MSIPQDLELLIYKYKHELCMVEIRKELSYNIILTNDITSYLRHKTIFSTRKKLYNQQYEKLSLYFENKIYRYIHSKSFWKSLFYITKPVHILF